MKEGLPFAQQDLSVENSADFYFVFSTSLFLHSLSYFVYCHRSGELCYNFSISNDLTQIINVPTRIPDCDSPSPVCSFESSDTSICSTMPLLPLGNFDHVAVSVTIDFVPINCIAYGYSCADWDGLCDHLRQSSFRDIWQTAISQQR